MALTDRERAIAGFAWSAGNLGQTLEETDDMLVAADFLGGFDSDFVARSAMGFPPSEAEIRERILKTAEMIGRKKC